MSLLPFFQWCEASSVGTAIHNSTWAFAVIESCHLLGLAVIGGAVLVVDLRMLGLGLRRHAVADLARDAHPWLVGSLLAMLSTGIPLFLSEPIKCYYSTPFWVKMTCLLLAIVMVRFRLAEAALPVADERCGREFVKCLSRVHRQVLAPKGSIVKTLSNVC